MHCVRTVKPQYSEGQCSEFLQHVVQAARSSELLLAHLAVYNIHGKFHCTAIVFCVS